MFGPGAVGFDLQGRVIVAIHRRSQAARLGLRPGMKIIKINSKPIAENEGVEEEIFKLQKRGFTLTLAMPLDGKVAVTWTRVAQHAAQHAARHSMLDGLGCFWADVAVWTVAGWCWQRWGMLSLIDNPIFPTIYRLAGWSCHHNILAILMYL